MVVRSAWGPVLAGLAVAALVGCGGATPAANSPASETAVVHVGGAAVVVPAADSAKSKANADARPGAEVDPHLSRKAAVEEEEVSELGMIGLLGGSSGVPGGVSGGIFGGSLGQVSGMVGLGSGVGGLGLSGVGVSAGGSGGTIGLGSLGTIGTGGGTGYGSGSSSSNPVSGQSIHVSARSTIELGDAVTYGVNMEAAVRALRGRVYALRECYEAALDKNARLTGSLSIRLSIGLDGHVALVRDMGSDLADEDVFACIAKKMKETYVVAPTGNAPGAIETVVFFRPAPKK